LLYMQRDRPLIRIIFVSFCVKRDKGVKGCGVRGEFSPKNFPTNLLNY
jgi:hypothetical protein